MRGLLAGVEEFASGFSGSMAHTVSDDWVWSWPTRRGEMGRGVRIELAPCLVRPWCWLSRHCCAGCAGCGGGGVPACWGGRCHLVSFVLAVVVVFGKGGEGLGFGLSAGGCRYRRREGGGCRNWRREEGALWWGRRSLSCINRSRDAPAQGFSARAAGAAAGQGDNDKDLGGQGPIMMGAFPSLRRQDFQ